MNSLLKRQIRKYLPKDLQSNKDLDAFLDAINRSYTTSNEQFVMLQRATTISSDELFNANNLLKKESDSQKEIIKKLKSVINTLKFYNLNVKTEDEVEMDSSKLVDFIDNQTKEIIKINTQRDKLLKNLEIQNKELNEYTHMVSHDLKSPLQSIDAIVSWIKEDYKEVLNDDFNDKINLITQNVEKMDTLVKSILEYSTIGKLDNDFYKVDLNLLLKDVLHKIKTPKHIQIEVQDNLPIIIGDVYRLEQLFIHLIDNAQKFNDKKEGIIKIGFKEEESHYQFFVKDNGLGIEEKYFDKIFQAFQKLENNFKSSGIGLAIVKKIVNLYQGKIWLTSTPKKGTTFYFTIKK
ncbi:sensor histidine kinase [Polaribacter aestuariivivens]|uniref:sensor histidine kinase n=1 Tax=Polaribacter aestuariivivens TaxID=2304626 RepID=UPI003F4962FF